MARAGAVHGIKPKRSLHDNAAKVIDTRLEEFLSWRGALDDADRITELHDMRIAAKRLRYALEIFEPCFGGVKPVLKEFTAIQDALGEIHDLDVFEEVLRHRLQVIDAPLEEQAAAIMESSGASVEKTRKLRRLLSAQARDAHRLGLLGLLGDKIAERRRRFARFQERWGGDRLNEFADLVTGLTCNDTDIMVPGGSENHQENSTPQASIASIGREEKL